MQVFPTGLLVTIKEKHLLHTAQIKYQNSQKMPKSADSVYHRDLDIGHTDLHFGMRVGTPHRSNNYHTTKECALYCRNVPPKCVKSPKKCQNLT